MKDMRPDRDPRRLTDLLRGVVPDGPDPAGRADQVARRAKRTTRRRGAVSALAVGVVAAAVVVTPHFLDTSPVSNEASTSTPTPDLANPYTCPTAGQTPRHAVVPARNRIPAGVVLARICPEPGGPASWKPPLDALTTNVDGLRRIFNSLPAPPPSDSLCIDIETNDNFTLTFQYPDGHLLTVGSTMNCDTVTIPGKPHSTREGAKHLLAEYVSALDRQRSNLEPPRLQQQPDLTCPPQGRLAAGLLPTGRELGLTTAVVCFYDFKKDGAVREGSLSPAQVRDIDADYAVKATRDLRVLFCDGIAIGQWVIIGRTAWGDDVVLRSSCGAYANQNEQGPRLAWTPSQQVVKEIDSAAAGPSR
jgi:hypothetical protein